MIEGIKKLFKTSHYERVGLLQLMLISFIWYGSCEAVDHINHKNDLKVYTILLDSIKQIEKDSIIYPQEKDFKKKTLSKSVYKKNPPVKLEKLDLNEVDSLDLIRLRGIGPVLSSRIVRFRDRLGGYVHIQQILEVFNMTEDGYNSIKAHCFISPAFEPHKVSINDTSFRNVLRHPYFEYEIVKNIFNYRDQHGMFNSTEELKEVYLMTDSIFLRINPYVTY